MTNGADDGNLTNLMLKELSADLRSMRKENHDDHVVQRRASAELDRKVSEALSRLDIHDKWHGQNDSEIARRLITIEGSDHDNEVSDQAVSRYKQRFAWINKLGLDIVKALAIAGASTLLLGIGWALRMIFT